MADAHRTRLLYIAAIYVQFGTYRFQQPKLGPVRSEKLLDCDIYRVSLPNRLPCSQRGHGMDLHSRCKQDMHIEDVWIALIGANKALPSLQHEAFKRGSVSLRFRHSRYTIEMRKT